MCVRLAILLASLHCIGDQSLLLAHANTSSTVGVGNPCVQTYLAAESLRNNPASQNQSNFPLHIYNVHAVITRCHPRDLTGPYNMTCFCVRDVVAVKLVHGSHTEARFV